MLCFPIPCHAKRKPTWRSQVQWLAKLVIYDVTWKPSICDPTQVTEADVIHWPKWDFTTKMFYGHLQDLKFFAQGPFILAFRCDADISISFLPQLTAFQVKMNLTLLRHCIAVLPQSLCNECSVAMHCNAMLIRTDLRHLARSSLDHSIHHLDELPCKFCG